MLSLLHWNNIIGQRRAQDVLERAIASDRMHHAYLFVGPDGVGKLQTALALAEALNCVKRDGTQFAPGCGACHSCRKIAARQHPDVHVVEPDGQNIKIDQIRAIQKAATRRPYEGRFQVVVVSQAHQMGDEAANALLKTLEEPPPAMRFVVVTDQPNRLLDTIRSRCQLLRFGSLTQDEVRGVLASQRPPEAEWLPEQVDIAARFAEGSPGRAMRILSSGMLERRNEAIALWMRMDAARPKGILDAAETFQRDKPLLLEFADILKIVLRDVMLLKTVGNTLRCVNADLVDQLAEISVRMTMDDVLARIALLDQAQRHLERPINAQLIAEDLLLRLALPRTDARPTPRLI